MGLKERRQREKAARKRQILDAARSLLMTEGLPATSIHKIAGAAELGVGTLYSYFNSKEEIFAALQIEGLEHLYADVLAAMKKEDSPSGRLKAIAREYVAFSRKQKTYFDIINYFLSSPEVFFTPQLKEQVDAYGNRIIDQISQTVQTGITMGSFQKVDARRFAIMLWGTLHGLIQFKKLKTTVLKEDNHEALLESAIEYLINGLDTQSGTKQPVLIP
ncbi:MAG: TetR/AcrR family transcriptional regulator [Deltaproteobacteria bacterium]|nr:TetR/AcrR family transcriptional regulator [Deltaproteobacteria bacterium]MCF8120154.1 TetR/AcrR family transcriptional regulator [Deltaproteobacteria bacterium]